jgi:hypothetical protein
VSNRKQAHRRRAYGRRQHEIHERRERGEAWPVDWIGGGADIDRADVGSESSRSDLGGGAGSGIAGGGTGSHADLRWDQGA